MKNKKLVKCVCGLEGSPSVIGNHSRSCEVYIEERKKVKTSVFKYIEALYDKHPSVSEIIDIVKEKEKTSLSGSTLRKWVITPLLKELNISHGYGDAKFEAYRLEKSKKTNIKKYGVENISKINCAFSSLNKIPFTQSEYFENFKQYKKKVERLTKRNVKIILEEGKRGTKCEYTGIIFTDEYKQANPNDPYKRTIDHKIPVAHGFLKKIPEEEISEQTNLVFCCRMINTFKGNTDYKSFMDNLLPSIDIEFLKNESKQNNKIK